MRIISRLAAVALAAVVGLMPVFASAQPRQWYPRSGPAQMHRPPAGPVMRRPPPRVTHRWDGPQRTWRGDRYHHRYYHRHYRYRDGWDPGAAAVAGGIVGLAVGSMVAGSATTGDAHVERCLRRYRSYDPASDTYLGYDGRRHYCRL